MHYQILKEISTFTFFRQHEYFRKTLIPVIPFLIYTIFTDPCPTVCSVLCKSLQSCPTLCDPMDCSPPHSSVHGILQARILEGVAMPSSRGSSRPRDRTPGLLHCRQILYCLSCQRRSVLNNFCPLLHNGPAPCLLKDGEALRGPQ